jgi:hypothetical protein
MVQDNQVIRKHIPDLASEVSALLRILLKEEGQSENEETEDESK